MKSCPYCKEEIQDDALKCPHCGEFMRQPLVSASDQDRQKRRRYFLAAVLILFMLFVLAGMFILQRAVGNAFEKIGRDLGSGFKKLTIPSQDKKPEPQSPADGSSIDMDIIPDEVQYSDTEPLNKPLISSEKKPEPAPGQ